jgi:hypothetical protein
MKSQRQKISVYCSHGSSVQQGSLLILAGAALEVLEWPLLGWCLSSSLWGYQCLLARLLAEVKYKQKHSTFFKLLLVSGLLA